MVWGLICLVFLYLGYKLNSRKLETDFGTDIYSLPESYDDASSIPLSYRQAQLLQFGLTFGIEGFFGAVLGVIYGPLTMIWCVLGSVFIGSFLNYYSGMFSRAHKCSLISVIKHIYGWKIYVLATLTICLLLMVELGVNFIFFMNITATFLKATPIWYIFLAVVFGLGVVRPRDFAYICMGAGTLIVFTTVYSLMMSLSHLSDINIGLNILNYPNIKYAYPVMFFTISIGVLSGIQALKSSLTAEYIKNERMGKGVFIATTLFQAGTVVLWVLLLLAWNPSYKALTAAIAKVIAPEIILHDYLSVHMGKVGEIVLFLTLGTTCIISAGAMLRLALKLLQEANIGQRFSVTTKGVILFVISFVFMYFPFALKGYELISQLLALFLLWMCFYLRKTHKQSTNFLLYTIYVLIGGCVAYFPIAVFKLPLIAGIFCGFTTTFFISLWHWVRLRKS